MIDSDTALANNMRPCQGTRKDGQPCQAWVFPPYSYCRWHRPEASPSELSQPSPAEQWLLSLKADKRRLEARRNQIEWRLGRAERSLARPAPDPDPFPVRTARRIARQTERVRALRAEREEIDEQYKPLAAFLALVESPIGENHHA